MPSWVTSARAETLEDVAFLSGAALATCILCWRTTDVPHALLRDRLALRAAEASCHVCRPAGDGRRSCAMRCICCAPAICPDRRARSICRGGARWSDRFRSRRCTGLAGRCAEQIAVWLDAGQGAPVTRAATVLETVLTRHPARRGAGADPCGCGSGAGSWVGSSSCRCWPPGSNARTCASGGWTCGWPAIAR